MINYKSFLVLIISISFIIWGCAESSAPSNQTPGESYTKALACSSDGGISDAGADANQINCDFGVHLEQMGAIGDGIADDSLAMTSAIDLVNNGVCPGVQVSGKSFLVRGPFQLKRGFISGVGPISSIKTDIDAPIFTILSDPLNPVNGFGNNTTINNLSLQGNQSGIHQSGLQIGNASVLGSGIAYGTFHHLTISNMGGDCVSYAHNPVDTVFNTSGPIFSDLIIHNCLNGFDIKTQGEYIILSNSIIQNNSGWGLIIGAGNVIVSSVHVDNNHNGVYITDDVNNSHGAIDSSTFNHNTAISLKYTGTVGERITNSAFFQGIIQIDPGAVGLELANSQIDVDDYNFGNNSFSEFSDCIFGSSYGNVVSAASGSTIKAYHPVLWSNGSVPPYMAPYVSQ